MDSPNTHDATYVAESNTTQIVAVVTLFHIIALVITGLRLYVRGWIVYAPGWDDLMIFCSALCAIGGWSIFIIQSRHGLGHHQDTIPAADLRIMSQAGLYQSIFSAGWALTFLKISIAIALLRLGSTRKWYIYSLWGTIVLNVLNAISGTFVFTLFCRPMAGYWDKSINAKCASVNVLVIGGLVNTAINIFTDVLLATVPIPVIWSLNLELRKRLSIISIFSLGYAAVTMGIIKSVHQITYSSKNDNTFKQSIQFWGFLQLQVGIIAACAPSLGPLFFRARGMSTARNYTNSGSRRNNTGNNNGLVTIGGTNESRSKRGRGSIELTDHIPVDQKSSELSLAMTKGENKSAVTSSSFYRHSDTESGSEERILPSQTPPKPRDNLGGILRTREIIVQQSD
ncbi:hypothetical protein BKA67DRAFT_690438 [Truncatella angustata]|uniref:Rhodopsin domain-containing protein n=1 Tax=Truncatella angustata TaxID=152316 RepID=A0A9P8UNX5_9PEZI|nr:uncharacterized protein BKA67DRAFT_690438 [Truncatella angustata]KAH6655668.1 hypothetical protein BKA67DRAFT_690438 [Truncatella angustata]KAH8201938.1 hypothetical protein TruAng_003930 [Truncatella angustata]